MPFKTIMANKFTTPIIIALAVIIVVIVIYYLGKSKGRKTNEYQDPPNETGWGGNLTKSESDTVKRLTDKIYADIDSWSVSAGIKGRDCDAYSELVSSSDRITVSVANYYIQNYGTKLYDDIDGESFSFTPGCSGDIKTTVLNKLSRLNLR